ncbi:MAG: hypothetical protein ACP5M4_09740 [Acidobacteriaceae bacterium]
MILKRLTPAAGVALAVSLLSTQSLARAQSVKRMSGISRGDHYAGLHWATRSPVIASALRERGYKVKILTHSIGSFGGYAAIQNHAKDHDFRGASEMRRDGEVIGY